MSKTVSNKLCPAAAKTFHLTSWLRRSSFTSSASSPPISTHPKLSELVCKNDSLWCFIIIIVSKSPCSSSSSSFTSYVFLLRLDRLAPPAGDRLE